MLQQAEGQGMNSMTEHSISVTDLEWDGELEKMRQGERSASEWSSFPVIVKKLTDHRDFAWTSVTVKNEFQF